MDVIVSLARIANAPDTYRAVMTEGRFDEIPSHRVVDLTDEGYVFVQADGETETEAATTEALILAALPILPEASGRAELRQRLHRLDGDVLADLVHRGLVVRVGRGLRGDPFRYGRAVQS